MPNAANIKNAMKDFYRSEAEDRSGADWVAQGGSARIPEPGASHYFIDRKVAAAVALARLSPDSRVLEVGSSWGHMTFLLATRFHEVVAVDLSPESVALGNERARHYGVSNVRFLEGDAERLGALDDRSFDGAFSFSTLRFCPDPLAATREMFRVLRPGGRAVIDAPNRLCPWYGPLKRVAGIAPHIHDRLYSRAELKALMTEAGFSDLVSKHLLFTTKRLPAVLVPMCRLVDRVLEATPGVRSWSGIVMAAGTRNGGR